ncbi:Ribosome LSU-associated GTP-binding protein HflX [hydrothermal vent metagenome]|uniref:Ribosome LSU-associated GTP-binding protein HflX n=1 Tax=hydrothermal vent metagenome TaxID=652676 RepID=A0A3B0VV90_9ZZZZ
MFDRSERGDRAVLLCPTPMQRSKRPEQPDRISEFRELVTTAGAEIFAVITSTRQTVDAKYYIGSGKAEELAEAVKIHQADVVVVDAALSPIQERNLEALVKARVLDRRTLILDIFSQRARSYEGQLQVELAQLKHMSTRLVRGWTHLERQKGGIGMRGPGETQLETDRRLLNARVKSLNTKLNKVMRQREQGRKQRKKSGTKVLALVGYTNAGKSTLFNLLTDAGVYVKDQLFATLDPTVRQFTALAGSHSVISDTVGFVRDLPHELVAAFRATLQEALDADVLLHVIDDSNPEHRDHMAEVYKVLGELKIDDVPVIEIYNKIDQSGAQPRWQPAGERRPDNEINAVLPKVKKHDWNAEGREPEVGSLNMREQSVFGGTTTKSRGISQEGKRGAKPWQHSESGSPDKVWLSAHKNTGVDLLLKAIEEQLHRTHLIIEFALPMNQARLRAQLYELEAIRNEQIDDSGQWQIEVELPLEKWLQLAKRNDSSADFVSALLAQHGVSTETNPQNW